jgi:transcriptional regulator
MAKCGRKTMVMSEQDIADIMLLNSQGHKAKRIANMLGKPYYKVLEVIRANGGEIRKGRHVSDDGTTKKEQAKALWESGLHNVDIIAKELNTSRKNILWYLNHCHNIKTRPTELPIDFEAEQIAQRHLRGEYTRGEISALAKKYKVTRQYAHQRINLAKTKLKA